MSNPGVIVLSETVVQKRVAVQFEDNIGECVHIHIGTFRIDLSLSQFATLTGDVGTLLDMFCKERGLDYRTLGLDFLDDISSYLVDLEHTEVVQCRLKDLQVETKGRFGLKTLVPLSRGAVVKALQGDSHDYMVIRDVGQDAADARLQSIRDIFATSTYGENGQLIVVFNDQLVVRDGQHRASYLYTQDPESTVDVLRLKYKGNRHNILKPLWWSSITRWPRARVVKIILSSMARIKWYRRGIASKLNRYRNKIANRKIIAAMGSLDK